MKLKKDKGVFWSRKDSKYFDLEGDKVLKGLLMLSFLRSMS
jgi:hypothetical protein